jgi:hypothetical protein
VYLIIKYVNLLRYVFTHYTLICINVLNSLSSTLLYLYRNLYLFSYLKNENTSVSMLFNKYLLEHFRGLIQPFVVSFHYIPWVFQLFLIFHYHSNVWHLPRTMTTFNMHDLSRKVKLSNYYLFKHFHQTQDLMNMMQDFTMKAERAVVI